MVERYDHVKPRKDLERWLEYVGMTEEEFDETADTFRDPRVWAKDEDGDWVKDSIRAFDAAPPRWRLPPRDDDASRQRGRPGASLRETDIRPDELMAEQARRYAGRRRVAAGAPRPLRRVAVSRLRRASVAAAVAQVRPRLPSPATTAAPST